MQTHSERLHCASEWPCGASTQALNSGTVRGRRSPRVSGSVQPWPRCLVAATVARAGANARAATADAACPRPSRLRGHSISRGRSGAGRASGCASPVRIAQPGHARARGAQPRRSRAWFGKGKERQWKSSSCKKHSAKRKMLTSGPAAPPPNQSGVSVPASVGRTFLGTAPFSEPGDALRVVPPPGAPRTACSPSRTTP